jgi:hypothetical protein
MALPEPPETPRLVSLVDLDGDVMAAIEEDGGASLATWSTAPSTQRQAAAVVAHVFGYDLEECRKSSIRVLSRYIDITLDAEADAAAPKARPNRAARRARATPPR